MLEKVNRFIFQELWKNNKTTRSKNYKFTFEFHSLLKKWMNDLNYLNTP